MPSHHVHWSKWIVIAAAIVLLVPLLISPAVSAQSQSSNDTLDLEITSQSTYVSAGESVSVEVLVQNTGDTTSPAPVFNLTSVPSGWNMTAWNASNATYRSATNEWLWTEVQAGEEAELTITLQALGNASDFSLTGEVTDGNDNAASTSLDLIIGSPPTPTVQSGIDDGGSAATESSQEPNSGGSIPVIAITAAIATILILGLILLYVRS